MSTNETQPVFDGYRELKRKHGTGYMSCTTDAFGRPKYKYEYPFALEIGNQLNPGDKQHIANATGMSLTMVRDVLAGRRYNEVIVDAAIARINQNKKLMQDFEPSKGVKEFINDLSKVTETSSEIRRIETTDEDHSLRQQKRQQIAQSRMRREQIDIQKSEQLQ